MDDILKIRAYHISEQSYVKIVELGFKPNGDIQYLIFTKPKNNDNLKSSFTKKEIEELKKRDDIAIDWDKAELEEVDDE